ncbi:MAG: HNH endonuclease [Candidatus Krumholzibacteriota bacterium]
MKSPIPDLQKMSTAIQADRALKQAVAALEKAEHSAVTWFGEILRRGLFRELGYSSIYQYAQAELKWSRTRTGDFIRLARKLAELPVVRESVSRGELGYTKARELIKVATPRTEKGWVEEAKSSTRQELARKVKRVKEKARRRSAGQGELLPEPQVGALAAEVPVRVNLEMTPAQFARYEALVEKLHKLGAMGDKVETMLQGLALLVEQRGTSGRVIERATGDSPGVAPRGASVQVHVHSCPDCRRATIATSRGDLELSRAERDRLACDARVKEPGKRNRSLIPPGRRGEVLGRDGHRCRAPGCANTRFLEVHHIKARSRGGGNDPDNLITLCSACHRLWHERGGLPPGVIRIPSAPRR